MLACLGKVRLLHAYFSQFRSKRIKYPGSIVYGVSSHSQMALGCYGRVVRRCLYFCLETTSISTGLFLERFSTG